LDLTTITHIGVFSFLTIKYGVNIVLNYPQMFFHALQRLLPNNGFRPDAKRNCHVEDTGDDGMSLVSVSFKVRWGGTSKNKEK
jgi:hypothetical protein